MLISRGDLLLFSLSLSPFSLSFDASVAYEFERRSKLAFLGDAEMTLGFLGICWEPWLGFWVLGLGIVSLGALSGRDVDFDKGFKSAEYVRRSF